MLRVGSIIVTVGLGLLALAALALSIYSLPTTLKVAVGPEDREHTRLITAFARKLQLDRAPLRLQLVREADFATAGKALEAGRVDLSVVRSDLMPRNGQSIAVLSEMPVLFMAPRAARITRVADLAGKRVGVMRGSPENLTLLDTVLTQAGLGADKVPRTPLEPAAAPAALLDRKVDVLMVVAPISGAADRTLHALERAGMKVSVIGVAEAEAIESREPSLDAIEVPRGALRGSPLVPDDDLPTVAATLRLAARDKLSATVINDLTRLLYTSRLALAADVPAAKSIKPPDTEAGAALPLHPGAAAYLAGERNGFFDRYGDLVYMGSMLAAMVASGIGSLLSFLLGRQRRNAAQFTTKLLDLIAHSRHAKDTAELAQIQSDADALLGLAFKRVSSNAIDGDQFATFAMLTDSVNLAIERRERQLALGLPAAGESASNDGLVGAVSG